jgi:dipeptidyl aminopeptidase/acylaminoacyl peptidase
MRYLLLSLALVLTSFVSAQELPLDHFTRHGDYLDMRLSPDGKHIAARVRNDGKVMFVVLETESMKVVGGVRPQNNDAIHSVEWINDERLVYQYAEKFSGDDAPTATGELFAINFDNSRSEMLFGWRAGEMQTGTRRKVREETRAAAEVVSYLPDDPKYILIAEYPFELRGNTLYDTREAPPQITKLNVYTGNKKKVETIPYKASKVWATESGEVKLVRYRTQEFTFKTAYRATPDDEWQDLSEILGDSYLPLGLSSDGTRVYLSGTYGEKRVNNIYEHTFGTEEVTPVFNDIEYDLYGTIWDVQQERPVVSTSSPTEPVFHYAKGSSTVAKWHKSLRASFESKYVTIASQSNDGRYLLVRVADDINPGEYYLFDTKTKGASFLWANRSWLDPMTLAATKPFSFEASDGLTIHGQVTLPKGIKEGQKVPFITMIHGGPHGPRDSFFFDSEVQLFANRGYGVVQINFRGSGGYGDVFESLGYRNWGTSMISDITQGTVAAAESFPLDSDNACVYGASYGGYAAMMSTIREPDMFKCVVGYVGLYNLSYFFTESDTARAYGGLGYIRRVLGTDEAELRANSPVFHADKITANVMIIHGDKDARVPVINAESMLEALEKAGTKAEYLNFGKSGHGVYDEKGRYKLYDAALKFFDRNLK